MKNLDPLIFALHSQVSIFELSVAYIKFQYYKPYRSYLFSFYLVLKQSQNYLVSYIIMFNNFTSQKDYDCCNIVVEAQQGRGALLIGDFNAATDEKVLSSNSIKTVITAAAGLDHLQIPPSVTHIVYPLQDAKTQNIKSYFDECFITIDRKLNEGGVLVHCAAGVSRSATLVIAYLMRKNLIGFKPAINIVRSKRAGICPNLGFEMQLKKYQNELLEGPRQQPKLTKKSTSEALPEDKRKSFQVKKVQNASMFDFQPLNQKNQKKVQIKKPVQRHTGYSKPRQKPLHEVIQTQLFVSGKSAKRPSSQVRITDTKQKTVRVDPLMGTWGPMTHKAKQFQL